MLKDTNLDLVIGGCLTVAFYNAIKNVFENKKNFSETFLQELKSINNKMKNYYKYNNKIPIENLINN